MKSSLLLGIGLTALALFSCEQPRKGERNKDGVKKVDQATPVETVGIRRGTIGAYILLNSTVETEKVNDIYAQTSGFVARILKEEGEYVKKGDVLVELDARESRLRLDKAIATYEKRKAEYERLTNHANKSVLSKEEVEGIKYQYDLARIERDEAQLSYDYSHIKSTISGVVSLRDVKVGDRVNVGKKVYQVTNLEEMIAVVNVPEKESGNVSKGQLVTLFTDNLKNANHKPKQFRGSVKRVSPVIDPMSGTFKVTVGIETNPLLKSGMFMNVHIQTNLHENALLLPKETLVYDNEQKFVYLVKDSLVRKVNVLPGYEDSYFIETFNPALQEGDSIVLLGKEGLKEDAKVNVIKHQSSSEIASN